MHLHLFPPPPPMPMLPLFLTAALAFAAGLLIQRRGVPRLIADIRGMLPQRLSFWRRDGLACKFESRASGSTSNTAFEDYKRATLNKLESEAQEFRTFLDGLRRSADAKDFQTFLQSRRDASNVKALPTS